MTRLFTASLCLFIAATALLADPPTPLTALARMPVKEVTVFKDGHALVLHSGKMPTDAQGNVALDALPTPVLGTFWPYSADKNVRLTSVSASARKVAIQRTAMSIRELLEANIGAAASITELPVGVGRDAQPISYSATIESFLTQSGEELEATSPPNSGEKLSAKSNIVLLKTAQGTKAVDVTRIVDVTFTNAPKTRVAQEEFRNLLTLHLDWNAKPAAKEAEVGLLYLQKGLRWIPNYKVTIDGKGNAVLKLQATLINELTDLDDANVHLVIGVPSFMFSHSLDPMSLQQAQQLSSYFVQSGDLGNNWSNRLDGQLAFNNGIMTQVARPGRAAPPPPAGGGAMDLGPEVSSQGRTEDLFLFSLKHVTLKKGQRMVLSVAEYQVTYKDIYVLDVPVAPPPEVFRSFDDNRKAEIARALAAPKVMHRIRLANKSDSPFTTAPALIVLNDRVIAQGMMTYTPTGASVDLDMTATVDVLVKKSDQEVNRTPRAERWNGDDYMRVDCAGKLTLHNHSKNPIEVEVVRHFMGNFGSADRDGKSEMLNQLEDRTYAASSSLALPNWHGWYNWPWWWSRFNSIGRITWNLTLEPAKPVELNYTWHYFWR